MLASIHDPGLIASLCRTGAEGPEFLHEDGHGDIVAIYNSDRIPLNQYEYDIWGRPIVTVERVENLFRYSGEYWDNSTELQYLRARWYDPGIGRFISQDAYEGELNNPLSLNLYTYVVNNPLKYIDPSGHAMEIDKNIKPRCNPDDLKYLNSYEKAWLQYAMQQAHDNANKIRLQYANSVTRIDFINGGRSSVSANKQVTPHKGNSVVQTYTKGEVSVFVYRFC